MKAQLVHEMTFDLCLPSCSHRLLLLRFQRSGRKQRRLALTAGTVASAEAASWFLAQGASWFVVPATELRNTKDSDEESVRQMMTYLERICLNTHEITRRRLGEAVLIRADPEKRS